MKDFARYLSVREGFKKGAEFSGVGGFESHFPQKNMVSICIKSPKYSFKSNFFFHMGGLTLTIFLIPNGC